MNKDVARKIDPIIRRMGSSFPAERAVCAEKLASVLETHGSSFHELADAVTGGAAPEAIGSPVMRMTSWLHASAAATFAVALALYGWPWWVIAGVAWGVAVERVWVFVFIVSMGMAWRVLCG